MTTGNSFDGSGSPDSGSGKPLAYASASTGQGEGVRVTLPGQATPQERWLWRGLLVVLCLLAYVPSFSSQFIWDDNRHAGMTALRDFDGLVAIWTKVGLENGGTPQYYPLTHTTFWIEEKVFGRNPLGYRVVNVLLHAGSAMVLWELLKRLRVKGAFFAAALFAVHPMMAESVAWTSERKNTLSLLLGLTALLLYAQFARIGDGDSNEAEPTGEPDWNLYVWALAAGVGALLAKTMAASIPVLILLMLWWKGRLTPRHLGLVAPLLVAAVGLGLLTGYVEHRYVIRPGEGRTAETFAAWAAAKVSGSIDAGPDFDVSLTDRLKMAGVVPWFYASKLAAPIELMFFYPRWDLPNAPGWWWLGWVGTLGVVGVGVYAATKGTRWPLAVTLGYLVALFPAMGLVDVYPFRYSYVADHFSYHAVWMLLAAVAAGVAWVVIPRVGEHRPQVVLAAAAVVCVVLGARTYVHSGHFIDNYALFSHTLSKNPNSWAAAHNLALEYVKMTEETRRVERQLNQQLNLAVKDGRTGAAEEIRREIAAARTEGNGFLTRSEELLKKTLDLRPNHEWAHHSLGTVAAMQGRTDEALAYFEESVRRRQDPKVARDGTFPGTLMNIGDLKAGKGDLPGAIEAFRAAIAAEDPPIKPKHPGPRLSLLRQTVRLLNNEKRRPTEAETAEIRKTSLELSELAAKNEEAWLVIGDAMQKIGMLNDAVVAYREAINVNVGSVRGYLGMGYLMGLAGDLRSAEVALTEVLRLDPENAQARLLLEQVRAAATRPTTGPASQPASQPAGG